MRGLTRFARVVGVALAVALGLSLVANAFVYLAGDSQLGLFIGFFLLLATMPLWSVLRRFRVPLVPNVPKALSRLP